MKSYNLIKQYYYHKSDLNLKFGSKLTNQFCFFKLGIIDVISLQKNDKLFFKSENVLLFYVLFSILPFYNKKNVVNFKKDGIKIKEEYYLQVILKKLDIYRFLWYIFCVKHSNLTFSIKSLNKYKFSNYMLVSINNLSLTSLLDYFNFNLNIAKCTFSLIFKLVKNNLDSKQAYTRSLVKHLLFLWEL